MPPGLCYPAVVSCLGSWVLLKYHLPNLRNGSHRTCLTITTSPNRGREAKTGSRTLFFSFRFTEPGSCAAPELHCSAIPCSLVSFCRQGSRILLFSLYYPCNLSLSYEVEDGQCGSTDLQVAEHGVLFLLLF